MQETKSVPASSDDWYSTTPAQAVTSETVPASSDEQVHLGQPPPINYLGNLISHQATRQKHGDIQRGIGYTQKSGEESKARKKMAKASRRKNRRK